MGVLYALKEDYWLKREARSNLGTKTKGQHKGGRRLTEELSQKAKQKMSCEFHTVIW
jgi:hypothetical protein